MAQSSVTFSSRATLPVPQATSSILLPCDMSLEIVPEYTKDDSTCIITDGIVTHYKNVDLIKVEFSETSVNLLRFETYDFWNKVKTKFL